MMIRKKKRNIQFYSDKIKYNAIKKFGRNTIKIPSYIIDEVFRKKIKIEIYQDNKYITTYHYDNLKNFITMFESKQYKGKFRDKDIVYTLAHVEI